MSAPQDDWKARAIAAEAKYDALERQRDSLANENVELKRIAEEADNVVCWGVDCVHQANALDIVAKAEEERAALCDRIVELSKERDHYVEAYRADHLNWSRISGILCDAGDVNTDPQPEGVAALVVQRDDARRQMVDMKREVEATHDQMKETLAELGMAKRRVGELERVAMCAVEAFCKGNDADSSASDEWADVMVTMAELRRVATGKGGGE